MKFKSEVLQRDYDIAVLNERIAQLEAEREGRVPEITEELVLSVLLKISLPGSDLREAMLIHSGPYEVTRVKNELVKFARAITAAAFQEQQDKGEGDVN